MFIDLDKNLSLKPLDPNNQKDIWLANTLDSDETVNGEDGFLYSIHNILKQGHKYKGILYGMPYAIYQDYKDPIGYLEVSEIFGKEPTVILSYALVKEKRGHGYMSRSLKGISNLIFKDKMEEIKNISLIINKNNDNSKKTALSVGFIIENDEDSQYDIYNLSRK